MVSNREVQCWRKPSSAVWSNLARLRAIYCPNSVLTWPVFGAPKLVRSEGEAKAARELLELRGGLGTTGAGGAIMGAGGLGELSAPAMPMPAEAREEAVERPPTTEPPVPAKP